MSSRTYTTPSRSVYLKQLPDIAYKFLELLVPTRKPSTCRSYKVALSAFYTYLQTQSISLESIQRKDLTQWFSYLSKQDFSASYRVTLLVNVRGYLRWLYEQELFLAFPDELIQNADLPKQPKHLPRPLSLEIDAELQKKLTESQSVIQKGLLLLRKTGMRVGELISLPYDCIHTDHSKNTFIKVPLGKLNNERLVPVDKDTLQLIRNIQSTYPPKRTYLIESQDTTGLKAYYGMYWKAFRETIAEIELQEPITIHQLRHSYASELINAGMRLECVQLLLGHLDYRMTLRYAAVTLQTVTEEFYRALEISEEKYQTNFQKCNEGKFNPIAALTDLNQWLHNTAHSSQPTIQQQARLLIRRVQRMKNDFEKMTEPR